MPVVKTTSPVTGPGAPTASPSKRVAVLEQDVARSCGAQGERPLPVDDGAGGDRREHPAAAACARRSSSSPSGSRSRPRRPPTPRRGRSGTRSAGAPTAIRGVGRSEQRGARRELLDHQRQRQHAGHARARCRPRRTRSPARSCPSAPPRTAPPSPRARAARGRWRCSRWCRRAGPSISAWRSASARSGGFIFSRVSSRSSSASSVSVRWCGDASQVIRTPRALASATASTDSRGAQVLDVDAAVLVAGDRGVAGDHRRLGDATGCRPGRAARRPRPRA